MLAVIEYAKQSKISKLFAGHNPHNLSSEKMLLGLGFIRVARCILFSNWALSSFL